MNSLLDLPSSFDPAIHLHSELDLPDAPKSTSYSDDFTALHECLEEKRIENIRNGVVIQHRRYQTTEVFRSEEDHPIDTPPRHQRTSKLKRLQSSSTIYHQSPPSSPPINAMPLISSPMAYPPTSSPNPPSPKKRKRSDTGRSPLKAVQGNNTSKRIGGFLDESDDEEELAAWKEADSKRRAIADLRDTLTLAEPVGDYTPPASQDEVILDPETVPVAELDNYFKSPSPARSVRQSIEEPAWKPKRGLVAKNASGMEFYIGKKSSRPLLSYEQLIAARSVAKPGRARKSYYGIDIHQLIDDAVKEDEEKAKAAEKAAENKPVQSVEQTAESKSGKRNRTLMWTEKYRARKFTDLVGDERTHRSVLKWLKAWDDIVFPGTRKSKSKAAFKKEEDSEEQKHRKILLLTGPPGLGKTTLAHVCARQAGYEVQEINASDERSRDVVKGRIRDMVGYENVRGTNTNTTNGKIRKAGKPVCVVVDEVDGVVGGSGGGEGGFIKALIDLINLDEKNSRFVSTQDPTALKKKKKKGDNFRLLRPVILICNDVYHPSLRPLRQSSMAEIVYIRKPALNMVVSRMHSIFEMEGIPCDSDGVRRLCEATWGVSTKKEGGTGSGTGEGDIRGIMVVGEWVAGKLRATTEGSGARLTRKWIEENILNDLSHGGGAARSLGRGGAKDVVERVFREGAGFPRGAQPASKSTGKQGAIGVAEASKARAMERLREMIETSGDSDKIVTDCFTAYPSQPFQDDTLLSKPNTAYDWLHFHDTLSSKVFGSQEWELGPYLSQSVLAFHDLFASTRRGETSNNIPDSDAPEPAPYSGPSAPYTASENLKVNRAQLMALHSSLSIPLTRLFRSPEDLATDLLPYVLRILSPDVKPVIVNTGPSGSKSFATASVRKASEKSLVKRAVEAMAATGVRFERSRVEIDDLANRSGGWVFRMEPPLDQLAKFETLMGKDDKVRYAVRQVLESEWKRESARIDAEARRRRGGQVGGVEDLKELHEPINPMVKEKVKRDFFGRVIATPVALPGAVVVTKKKEDKVGFDEGRIWVSFHEGFSNAVRKPITIDELMRGL